ncbi:hypothetical protein K1719_022038 [Acacia pycnantha]|nr:hypothetical protein K1719_022038 [Acacia pycnantha]
MNGQRRWPEDTAWHPDGSSLYSVYTADAGESQISVINLSRRQGRECVNFLEDKPHSKGYVEVSSTGKPDHEEDRLVLTAGATFANKILMFCLADPGEAFLLPTPYYPAFDKDLKWRTGVEIVPIHCSSSNGFKITPFALEQAYEQALSLNLNVKGVLVTNPSNPLGEADQAATNSLPSSSEKSSSSALHLDVKEGLESEEEIRTVPELGGESAGTSVSRPDTSGGVIQGRRENQRKRGRNAADKETKRLKRLLTNRVSAQQARERKKAYLNDLETGVKDLEEENMELKERLSTLQNENQMLRHILKNTTASRRGGNGSANEGTL